MHATPPLTTALTLCLTFLISSVFAVTHQYRGTYSSPVMWGTLSAETWADDLPAMSDLPPAVWQMCAGGVNATIVHSSSPVEGADGLVLTTGSCINNDTARTLTSTTPDDYHKWLTIAIDHCSAKAPNSLFRCQSFVPNSAQRLLVAVLLCIPC